MKTSTKHGGGAGLHKGCGLPGSRRARKKAKGRSESGSSKPACQANWIQRWACRRGRSHQDKQYPIAMKSIDKRAGRVIVQVTHGLGRNRNPQPFNGWLGNYMRGATA